MATAVDKKTSIEWDTPISRGRFPWDEWLEGGIWQAVQGEDFQSSHPVFLQQLRKRAQNEGIEVKTRVEKPSEGQEGPVSVFFQFVR